MTKDRKNYKALMEPAEIANVVFLNLLHYKTLKISEIHLFRS